MENKRIDYISNIMSKSHCFFTENFTENFTIFFYRKLYHLFLPKTLPSFFQMQEKLETCRNSNLKSLKKPFFRDNINITFTSQQPVPWIKNSFLYFKNFIQ